MEDTVDVFDGFGGKLFFPLRSALQVVIKPLNHIGIQCFQPDGAQGGLDVIADLICVGDYRKGLYASQVICGPEIQPLAHGDLAGLCVCAGIDSHSGSLHPLAHLFLGFAGEGSLHLLPCAGIKSHR